MNVKHWGDIPSNTLKGKPDVREDIEKAMDKFCLSEFNPTEDVKPTLNRPIMLPSQDPLVLYAISLHKYMNQMTSMISSAEKAIKNNVRPSDEKPLTLPDPPDILSKHQRNSFLNFIPRENTDFIMGKEVDVPVLNEEIVKKILRKCICTLLAHIGYESTHESLLNILVDVVSEFYRKICSQLRIAIHDEKEHGASGFPHALERVLVECGIGGARGIHDYYQSRVIKYVSVLQKRSKDLNNYFNYLSLSENTISITDNKMTGIKIEKQEIDENPLVHFLDGEIQLPSLETGYQLLDSLEAETNLQNLMEGEEENITTESAATVVESDYATFNKRKRTNF